MIKIPSIDPVGETDKIVNFIQTKFRETQKTRAIMALSGGLDSATSLLLTVKALGPENVHCLHLPAKNSHPIHTEHAQLLIAKFHIPASNFQILPLGAIIQKSWRIIKHHSNQFDLKSSNLVLSSSKDLIINRLRLANLAARIRMTLLFDQAKKLDALVIGTENLSEYLLGYYTRFGDEASDLEPIRHLYKTQVIELAKYLGVPEPIIQKPPSADLWPGQTDAQELGFTYQDADPILYQIQQGQVPERSPLVEAVTKQINRNHFKQEVPYHL